MIRKCKLDFFFKDNFSFRSSCPEAFFKNGVLKNFTKLPGKGLRPATLIKRDFSSGASCEFCEIFKNTYVYKTPLDDCFCRFLTWIWFFLYKCRSNSFLTGTPRLLYILTVWINILTSSLNYWKCLGSNPHTYQKII